MKTLLKLRRLDGEPVLVDLDAAIVVEPIVTRGENGRYENGTRFTYPDRVEVDVEQPFAEVLGLIMTSAKVAPPA